jgi:hypothetical protein
VLLLFTIFAAKGSIVPDAGDDAGPNTSRRSLAAELDFTGVACAVDMVDKVVGDADDTD